MILYVQMALTLVRDCFDIGFLAASTIYNLIFYCEFGTLLYLGFGFCSQIGWSYFMWQLIINICWLLKISSFLKLISTFYCWFSHWESPICRAYYASWGIKQHTLSLVAMAIVSQRPVIWYIEEMKVVVNYIWYKCNINFVLIQKEKRKNVFMLICFY